MNYAKYIVIDGRVPVVFSGVLTHKDVANSLASRDLITSAGFAYITSDGQYATYGRSESLNIDSAETDSRLLNSQLGGNV